MMGHNYNDQMDGDEVDDTEHLDEEPVQLTVNGQGQPRVHEMDLENKLLLTLVKLKLGISFTAISGFFGVSATTAKIFVDTLYYRVDRTKQFVWPSRIINQRMMYECFSK